MHMRRYPLGEVSIIEKKLEAGIVGGAVKG